MSKHRIKLFLLIFLGLFGYILPWIVTPTAPLTLGAYDLAEWASLHPSQLHTSPVLLVPFLLRLQLTILTWLFALITNNRLIQLITFALVIILAVAQLPPIEFFTIARDNINYQQQLFLTLISLVGGVGLVFYRSPRIISLLGIFLPTIGIITATIGLREAQNLYTLSFQEYSTGLGVIILNLIYFIIGFTVMVSSDVITMRYSHRQTVSIKQGST